MTESIWVKGYDFVTGEPVTMEVPMAYKFGTRKQQPEARMSEPRPYADLLHDETELARLLFELEGYMRVSLNDGTDTRGRMFAYDGVREINRLLRGNQRLVFEDKSPEQKWTYSVCPKTATGLHEWERLPPKPGGLLLTDNLSEAVNVVRQSDMQCTLCGKLYSEHATAEKPAVDGSEV